MEDKIVEFNGKIYKRSPKSRYYFEYKTKPKDRIGKPQLHRAVWEYYNGEIPKGFQIHHKDGNIDNNDISNLECLSSREHLSNHSKKNWQNEEYREKMRGHLFDNKEKQQKAKEWHKSPEGREWHKQHARHSICKFKFEKEIKCQFCGKTFITHKPNGKYCSSKCQQKACNYARPKICEKCGKEFHTTSYRAKQCRECRTSL